MIRKKLTFSLIKWEAFIRHAKCSTFSQALYVLNILNASETKTADDVTYPVSEKDKYLLDMWLIKSYEAA